MESSSARRDAFRKDGVVLLRGALDRTALAEAQRAYEWSLAHPSRGASTFPGSDGVFYQDLANRDAWPAYVERRADAYRVYYRWVGKGTFEVVYRIRLDNPGTFALPPTRVEAMYAPERFAELPNESIEVTDG